eukprot:INCI9938.6.p1 GENE.INCI9938.6~~INCI9938.6.p1  ORF type:complete len:170 (+),score=15.33 INCI9938.6:285-794(+)
MSHVRNKQTESSDPLDANNQSGVETADMLERQRISQWMLDCDLEILCLVEGMDPITSDTVGCERYCVVLFCKAYKEVPRLLNARLAVQVQALHSYTPSDIVWDRQFAPCVFPAAPVADRRCCGMRPMLRRERHRRSRLYSEGRLEIDLDRFHELIALDHPAALDRPSHL